VALGVGSSPVSSLFAFIGYYCTCRSFSRLKLCSLLRYTSEHMHTYPEFFFALSVGHFTLCCLWSTNLFLVHWASLSCHAESCLQFSAVAGCALLVMLHCPRRLLTAEA